MKLWKIESLDKAKALELQKKYSLPPIVAMLLQIRGIETQEEINDFLFNNSEIADPLEIKDMDKAAARVQRAIDEFEPVCIYGDYDADGVTSTALLYSYLEAAGANVSYYIPSRESEGYGMNTGAVDALHERGIKLIVTVDNGIAAANEIAYAKSLGIDTVVTDHHSVPEILPEACAVVDPHRSDCQSKFKNLCGVGVAFKLIMALEGEYLNTDALLDNYSDLLSIGTVGDVVELKGENRIFVKRGLKSLNSCDRLGLKALLEAAGLKGKPITSGRVSFAVVPRINAVGRLGQSQRSVKLLLTDDSNEAEEIAAELCSENSERQSIEADILLKIDEELRRHPEYLLDKIIVIDGEDWHQGVVGLAAQKVREAFGKPAIVITRLEDGTAKGSGRSVEGFALCDALSACSDLLTHGGGHPMAVGLSLKSENIPALRQRINEAADNFSEMPFESVRIECKLNPAYVNLELVDSLSLMQPYGAGNPTPVFGLFGMSLKSITPLSGGKHLRLTVERGGTVLTVMKFFTSTDSFSYGPGDKLDLAVTLERNNYGGRSYVSVIVKDIKPAGTDTRPLLESGRSYERFCRGCSLSKEELADIRPDRNDFALVYRFLKKRGTFCGKVSSLVYLLDNRLSFGKIRVIIKAMQQLGLININEGLNAAKIVILPTNGKVSLDSAQIIKQFGEDA